MAVHSRPVTRYVFVVTYGRSGSTLTQGLLNTLPRTLVRGENGFFVLHLFRAYAAVADFKRRFGKGLEPTSPFYGLGDLQPKAFIDSARRLTHEELLGTTPPASIDVLGFKEVRWHEVRRAETEEFFAFFEHLFPEALYVLHRRDHAQVSTSGFWRKREPKQVARMLKRVEAIQDHLRASRPERTLDTRYEDYVGNDPVVVDTALRRLATFVSGDCDDDLLVRLRATLGVGHGPRPFGESRKTPLRATSERDRGKARGRRPMTVRRLVRGAARRVKRGLERLRGRS